MWRLLCGWDHQGYTWQADSESTLKRFLRRRVVASFPTLTTKTSLFIRRAEQESTFYKFGIPEIRQTAGPPFPSSHKAQGRVTNRGILVENPCGHSLVPHAGWGTERRVYKARVPMWRISRSGHHKTHCSGPTLHPMIKRQKDAKQTHKREQRDPKPHRRHRAVRRAGFSRPETPSPAMHRHHRSPRAPNRCPRFFQSLPRHRHTILSRHEVKKQRKTNNSVPTHPRGEVRNKTLGKQTPGSANPPLPRRNEGRT